jgi:hypothetical protein
MVANAVFLTTIIFLALGIFLLQECRFLIPYRHVLFVRYGSALLAYAAALFLNLFAGVWWLCRTVFLKDTGRKLAHLEKQLRGRESILEELGRRLED